MLIVNADDWGRTREETDAALQCFRRGRVSSVTAMVFMDDSDRAAALAREACIDAGLHLNLSQAFASRTPDVRVRESHDRVVRFLSSSRFAVLLYHPGLRDDFRRVCDAQLAEFERLYGRPPSHVDGHQHKHLCLNMLWGAPVPSGAKVRRGFHFWPGEKSALNRLYRRYVDATLLRKYRSTAYFFALSQCLNPQRLDRVIALARVEPVELMTHPVHSRERELLLDDAFGRRLADLRIGTYNEI